MPHQKPFFSILIPTTGRAGLVRAAVKSVLAQTFQDFEIVIADIRNSEETRRLTDELGDARVRYTTTPTDRGAFIPWETSARLARGRYLFWLDDDNYLLPFALEVLSRAIEREGADIVTANHVYYYDATNPRRFLRNSLGIVPFTGGTYSINLREATRRLFSFSRSSRGPWPRFHYSELVVAREVVRRVWNRLGFLLFTDGHYTHSLQPILFSFARSCTFVDWPIVIIGRFGVSMSQNWSTAARTRFSRDPFRPRLSPLTAYTRINIVLDNYLRVKELLPDLVADIPVDLERFSAIHLGELSSLDTDLLTAIRNWQEVFELIRRLEPSAQKRLWPYAVKLALRSPFLWMARRAGLHYLWRNFRNSFTARPEPLKAMAGRSEFTIPIPPRYPIRSIAELALHLRDIMREETGRDIFAFK